MYTASQKNRATFIFTVTLANVRRFLKFFQCRNQKELFHNKNEKFPTVVLDCAVFYVPTSTV